MRARDPLLPFAVQRLRAGSGNDYHRFHAFLLLRSNAHVLRLLFELDDDDVYLDIGERLKLKGETEDMGEL